MFNRPGNINVFRLGEPVWVVHNGRVAKASVNHLNRDQFRVVVSIQGCGELASFEPGDVFKRPTEYHLLRNAIADLVEDLSRDAGLLLVESGS